MKSYGKLNSSWDKYKIRSMLLDASVLCKKENESVYIGIKGDEIIMSSASELYLYYVIVCTAVPEAPNEQKDVDKHNAKTFTDNDLDHSYTLDEMAIRVYEFLAHGIIRYGKLDKENFDKKRMFGIIIDMHHFCRNIYRKPLILGYTKEGIMVAPLFSLQSFAQPLSFIMTEKGNFWSISDMHSHLITSHPTKEKMHEKMCKNIKDQIKDYGIFKTDQHACILKLENAFEDAAKLAVFFRMPFVVGLADGYYQKKNSTYYSVIRVCQNEYGLDKSHITVEPGEFYKFENLSIDKIKDAARNAFKTFLARHEGFQVVKTYGKPDASWTSEKIKSMLEDMIEFSDTYNAQYCLGFDENQNMVIFPNKHGYPMHLFLCGISEISKNDFSKEYVDTLDQSGMEKEFNKRFWDHEGYATCTIDEMIPKINDFLTDKIITYGGLGFLSEGRHQLIGVLADAEKILKTYDIPLVVGFDKKRKIMIAPASKKSLFIMPLSCIVTKSGFWSVSNILSSRIKGVGTIIDAPDVFHRSDRYGVTDPMYYLYSRMTREMDFGTFYYDPLTSMIRLECIFEDAARMAKAFNTPFYLILTKEHRIVIEEELEQSRCLANFPVHSNQFYDGTQLDLKKIKLFARKAHAIFLDCIKI